MLDILFNFFGNSIYLFIVLIALWIAVMSIDIVGAIEEILKNGL